ncbi:MAG TPA: M23 family metallopeptidase [Thermoanaerobaculia bacterium]
MSVSSVLIAVVLTVTAVPRALPQGGVAEIRIKSDAPLASLVLVDGDRRILLERDPSGRTFGGLLGFDLDAKVGTREVVVETIEGASRLALPLEVLRGRFRIQKLSVDPKYVEVPPAEWERVKADGARVNAAYRSAEPARRWSSFSRPVAFEGGNFGARRVYNGKTQSFHAGLDMLAPMGTSVQAAGDGRVALAGDLYFSGGTVLLDHGGELFTQYMHLSRIDVKDGDIVAKGTILGLVGATGRVTGPHLHWGAKLHGARVNPEDLLALPAWPLPGVDAAR